ncbi:MAG: tryptophan synthase subunit alpha [Firmicutes bacterium]|nr:tryptophan synthase subunit alpha [Bacillota bacterium]
MNQVQARFQELRAQNRKAFIPYIMGGYPNLAATGELINLLAGCGADFIEVGVPFSDPLADGPLIQQAAVQSLKNGSTLAALLNCLKAATQSQTVPVILMMYYNMIIQRGLAQFFQEIHDAGCAGLIIPDLPPEEADEVRKLAGDYQIGLCFLAAPTSSNARIIQAAEASTGFLYAVSLKGVTGIRNELAPELPEFVHKITSLTQKPVAVGFGISTPGQAAVVAQLADGVIAGSAMIKAIMADSSFAQVKSLAQELRAAIGK